MSDQSNAPTSPQVGNDQPAAAEMSIPERNLSDERYRHMGSERESHLQAIRGMKRRSLIYDDDFPGSWWESVTSERYGPEQPTPPETK